MKLSSTLPVPREVLAQHVAILGKTRSGKSSVMRLLVEDLLDRKLPVCIVDPKGDWYGIKLSSDGKRPGYPVMIFGGERADIPINEHAGAQVAELFATGNRSCLIDLGGWMPGARTRFWIDFASTIFRLTKGERWLCVDEVHNFCPKGAVLNPDAGKMLHWTNRLASEGLGKGLAMIVASQRPQKVHNDTLTSCETLIAMRVLHPSDRIAVSDWIKGCGDSSGAEVLNSLGSMERGEGWAWSPEIKFGPARVKFPMFRTYDSFRPQTVQDVKRLTGWAEVDLDDVRAKMAACVERAKADDPNELRKRIAGLERQLKASAVTPTVQRVDIPVISGEVIDAANAILNQLVALQKGQWEHAGVMIDGMRAFLKTCRERPHVGAISTPRASNNAPPPRGSNGGRTDIPRLGAGERRVLTAIAQHNSVTREQLTVLTGYKRSSRDAYIQRLRAAGLVEPNANHIDVTADGVAVLGPDFEPLPSGPALYAYWRDRLPGGERAVLAVLVDRWPITVSRGEVSALTGYKRSSRDAYVQRLRSRKLVEIVGYGVRAARELIEA